MRGTAIRSAMGVVPVYLGTSLVLVKRKSQRAETRDRLLL